MSTPIVVNGALGRMGATIISVVQTDPDVSLAGMVDKAVCKPTRDAISCTQGTSLDAVLPQAPGAVVIDFTAPEATVAAAAKCAELGAPIVSGTTGLTPEQQAKLAEAAQTVPVLWSPNMSIGVNTLLQVLGDLVRKLGPNYDMELVELHHKMKKDAPSGTAIKLAQCLAEARDWDYGATKRYCRDGLIGERPHEEIGVQTIRGGDVVGVHTVYFLGPGERIEVTHQAHSRETFAQGAVRCAKWLAGQKPGKLYTFADML